MPRISIGTLGFSLQFTALLPPEAQKALEAKRERSEKEFDSAVAAFGLTPSWGNVPAISVADIREGEIPVPEHWNDTDEVVPLIHDTAFYIQPQLPDGMAASYSMKGVNIRTGLPEEIGLSDDPSQSYWSQYTPWIDGYVPSHAEAVRQFRPLQGEEEMQLDVARFVGIQPENPLIDAIAARFYLPKNKTKLTGHGQNYRSFDALTSFSFASSLESLGGTRGLSYGASAAPAEVGMGAGALMRQRHEDNPSVTADGFESTPIAELCVRMVWHTDYNRLAQAIGASPLRLDVVRRLREQQETYERKIWQQVGGKTPRKTEVDSFPG